MHIMLSVSVLIPAYNEANTIEDIVKRSIRIIKKCSNDYEIIILNDGSTDSTPIIIQSLSKKYPKEIKYIEHSKRQGIAKTLEELYKNGSKEIIIVIHGDGQYPPEIIPEILQKIEHSDIVIMARTKKYYSLFRNILSWCYRWIPRILFKVDLFDSGCSKCMKRKVVHEIPVISKSIFVEAERVIRATRKGYKISKADVTPEPRIAGKAKGGSIFLIPRVLIDIAYLFIQINILKRDK